MFGYIKPHKPILLVRDYEIYKDVYCSLCKQLGKDYGILARFTLSYDCTFYALFEMALKGECPQFKKGRCTFNPTKRCNYCVGGKDALSASAALSVITVYYKLCDDIKDSGFFKRMLYKLAKPIAGRWRKKAAKNYPQADNILKAMTQSQWQTEQNTACGIDASAMPTAHMMSQLMQQMASTDIQKKVFGEFGFYLGKWVYLIDAADDYSDDLLKGGFNPFVIRLKDKNFSDSQRSTYMNGILNENAAKLTAAYNLIDLKIFSEIIDNVVYHGIGQMQKQVIFDKDKVKIKRFGKPKD